MWRLNKRGLLALTSALVLGGCGSPDPIEVSMSLSAVNSADRILVIEGKTDLPSGAPLVAAFQDRSGKTLLRDQAQVRSGTFFFNFNLDHLDEFSSYQVEVSFDPERAPLGVRLYTGLWGEALQGPGVYEVGDKHIFVKKDEIFLSESAVGREWEGRDFETMEVGERSHLIAELERYIDEKPNDRVARLALARAYLADDSREYSSGSRAYLLLTDVARVPDAKGDREAQSANELLAEIETTQESKESHKAEQKELADGGRYRNDFVVVSGSKLGGFRMNTPFTAVTRYFELDRQVDFGRTDENPTIRLTDFHDIDLTFDVTSRRLIAARTTSSRFKLPEGLGVGSLVQSLQEEYGTAAIYTPEYEFVRTEPDGTQIYTGEIETDGLMFTVRREIDPMFGIPVDKVSAITVFRP